MPSPIIECPLCAGRGSRSGAPLRRRGAERDRCRLCKGVGQIARSRILRLLEQMIALGDAVQSGDAARVAREARKAGRVAMRLISDRLPHRPR